MESHQVHSHAKEKHFKHYLFEFLMLFLAITLSFFVENMRETYVEHRREKEYVRSMVADMKRDIRQLDSIISLRKEKTGMIDSLLWILETPDPDAYGAQIYFLARWLPRPIRIITSDGTMQQLKAGNLRLIRSRKTVDILMEYDQVVGFWKTVEEREESLIQQAYPSLKRLFDPRVFEKMVDGMRINRPAGNPKLLRKDKETLDEFYSHVHFLKNVNTYCLEYGIKRRKLAQDVLNILEEEYKVE